MIKSSIIFTKIAGRRSKIFVGEKCGKTKSDAHPRDLNKRIKSYPKMGILFLLCVLTMGLTACHKVDSEKATSKGEERSAQPSASSASGMSQYEIETRLRQVATGQLETYGLKLKQFKCSKGASDQTLNLYMDCEAKKANGDELLYSTSAVNLLMKRLQQDFAEWTTYGGTTTPQMTIVLKTPKYVVESRTGTSMGPIFRKLGDLETDRPYEQFVGSKALNKQWSALLKANGVFAGEKKVICDIIVRRSGTAYCQMGSLLLSLDGSKAYLSSSGKLLRFPDFEEVNEPQTSGGCKLLVAGGKTGYALFVSQIDRLLTLIDIETGKAWQINPYVVSDLTEMTSKGMIRDVDFVGCLFQGMRGNAAKPVYLVIALTAGNEPMMLVCPAEKSALFAETFISPGVVDQNPQHAKNIKSLKAWMDDGWLERLPDNIVVRKE